MNFYPVFPGPIIPNGMVPTMPIPNMIGNDTTHALSDNYINDMFNKFNDFDNRIKKLEQRVLKLESLNSGNDYIEPDNSLYMI